MGAAPAIRADLKPAGLWYLARQKAGGFGCGCGGQNGSADLATGRATAMPKG
jgi:hypothetical protein